MARIASDIYIANPANTPLSFLSHSHSNAYATIKAGGVYITDSGSSLTTAFTVNIKKHTSGTSVYSGN